MSQIKTHICQLSQIIQESPGYSTNLSVTHMDHHLLASSFRSGTAPGYDSISKNVVNLICASLTYIINLSLNSGLVPQEMKIARVIPLFKSGDKSLFINYRPISVLPVFSKFLERIVYNRLINFLNKYDILSRNQYGFRKNYSTAHALIQLYDKISNALDNKRVT